MRELFFYILNGATARIVGAIKRIGSAPGEKYSFGKIKIYNPWLVIYFFVKILD